MVGRHVALATVRIRQRRASLASQCVAARPGNTADTAWQYRQYYQVARRASAPRSPPPLFWSRANDDANDWPFDLPRLHWRIESLMLPRATPRYDENHCYAALAGDDRR